VFEGDSLENSLRREGSEIIFSDVAREKPLPYPNNFVGTPMISAKSYFKIEVVKRRFENTMNSIYESI
jgi:hypothetical protein